MSCRAWLALPALAPLLFSTSCLLNPIGEDPGFDDSPSDALGAAPSESGLGMVSPTSAAPGNPASGAPLPEPEVVIDDSPTPVPGLPVGPSPSASAPSPVTPAVTSPLNPPAMGTTAPTPEPGLDFDGGTLHYASPTDAEGPDGGTTLEGDAGTSSVDAAVLNDAGEVSP